MTITNGYTTLADVKSLLTIESVDVKDDSVIERMIENASRIIDGETWRRFYTTSADETRVYSARTATRIYTDDIISITSIKLDQDGDRTYEVTLATTDYDTFPDNASLRGEPITWIETSPLSNYTFTKQARSVQIVGKFGYAATAPDDLKATVENIVVNAYKQRYGVNTTGAATITGAGVVITPKDISTADWMTINHYKRLA